MSEQEYIDNSLDRSEPLTNNGGFYDDIPGMSEARSIISCVTVSSFCVRYLHWESMRASPIVF
ncbi:MAG TPA: hypothetical protein VK673_15385 [Chthoniobacterales bacterium]|nr:hypothetical protein [Chthoniobacterales bacterium]